MGNTTSNDTHKVRNALTTLRDEIKLKLHLANMDAKDEWKLIEPQVEKMEHDLSDLAVGVTNATREAVDALMKRLQALRAKLS